MKTDVEIQVDQDTALHKKELSLMMEKITKETEDLQESLIRNTETAEKAEQEIYKHESELENCTEQIKTLQHERQMEQRSYLKIKTEPGKVKNQTDVIQTLLLNTNAKNSELVTQLHEKETALNALLTRQKEVEMELTQTQSQCEQGRVAIGAKQTDIEDIQRDIDLTLTDYQQHLADRVQIDLFTEEKTAEINKAQALKRQANKEKEDYVKLAMESKENLQTSKSEIPHLETMKQKLLREKQELENLIKNIKEESSDLKKDEDILISEILKDEKHGAEIREIVSQVSEQNKILEAEIETQKNIEKANTQMHVSLIGKKDRLQRTLSSIMERQKEAEADLLLKDKYLSSLESALTEKQQCIAEFQELYDLMKKQKNQNEISKLSNELSNKVHQIEEESRKIEKTMATIKQCEQEMATEKKKFENVLQNRNYTGLLLIDRNDELCLLYEKSNLHEHILRQGELELKQREDEARMLKIRSRDLQRSIDASRKQLEQIPGLDKEIAWLQCQLLDAQHQKKEISGTLEDPKNSTRWRRLLGTDPEVEQLEVRIEELHEAIKSKQVLTSGIKLAAHFTYHLNTGASYGSLISAK
eukprot:g3103.t1